MATLIFGEENDTPPPKYGDSLFPSRNTSYDGFFVKLEPGQAVKLSGRLPDRWRYVSFVFYDRWYATLDYPQVRCYLTAKDLQCNPDGTYTIYLSAEDPGQPNWIQMGDLREGLFSYRYMLADANPKPDVQVVKLGARRCATVVILDSHQSRTACRNGRVRHLKPDLRS